MQIPEVVNRNIKTVVVVAIVVVCLPLLYSMVCFAVSTGTQSSKPLLELPDARFGRCVRDAKTMRYYHWTLLYEVRDRAMREGKETEFGIQDCRGCHTNRGKFCDRCHDVVNFSPDCFDCHYYPE